MTQQPPIQPANIVLRSRPAQKGKVWVRCRTCKKEYQKLKLTIDCWMGECKDCSTQRRKNRLWRFNQPFKEKKNG